MLRPPTVPPPTPSLRPTSSRPAPIAVRGLLLALALLFGAAAPTLAQIRPETPGRIRADTRRAQRQDRRTPDLPYQDTHLTRSKRQLKRGEGDQPHPEGADAYYYKKGNSPSVSDRNVWGLRRKKKAIPSP